MKQVNGSKKHLLCSSSILIPSLLMLLFFSCRKDEFIQTRATGEGVNGSFPQLKSLSVSSVLYYPVKTIAIGSKDTVDKFIPLQNKNYKYFDNFILTVQNGTSSNTKVQKVEILIDGITVISTSDFRKNNRLVSKALSGLTQTSVMEVRLDGSRNRFITLRIECSLRPGVISDAEGNYYSTVKIGDQWWMAENLKTSKYSNGDTIGTTIPSEMSLRYEINPQFQWSYRGHENTVDAFGRYYTWFTITDNRNICPANWHVPSDNEWKTLEIQLGMTQEQADQFGIRGTDQGTQMKSTFGWSEYFIGFNGTNTSGFTALPRGLRNLTGSFKGLYQDAWWWTITEINEYAICRNIYNNEVAGVSRGATEKANGLSVRCLKD